MQRQNRRVFALPMDDVVDGGLLYAAQNRKTVDRDPASFAQFQYSVGIEFCVLHLSFQSGYPTSGQACRDQ